MLPVVSTANAYDVWYQRGAFELAVSAPWAMIMTDPPGFRTSSRDRDAALRILPLSTLDVAATGREIQFYRDWLAHPMRDQYWDPAVVDDEYAAIEVPVYNIGGWYDFSASETIANYVGIPTLRKECTPVRGPLLVVRRADQDSGPRAISLRQQDVGGEVSTVGEWNHDLAMLDDPVCRL